MGQEVEKRVAVVRCCAFPEKKEKYLTLKNQTYRFTLTASYLKKNMGWVVKLGFGLGYYIMAIRYYLYKPHAHIDYEMVDVC